MHETHSEELMDHIEALRELMSPQEMCVTAQCLDDARLLEVMDIVHDLGAGVMFSTLLLLIADGKLGKQEADSMSSKIREAVYTSDERAQVRALINDAMSSPERFSVPAERRGDRLATAAWLVATAEQCPDPRARVIETRKRAAKLALDAVAQARLRAEASPPPQMLN